jgi:LemA protein
MMSWKEGGAMKRSVGCLIAAVVVVLMVGSREAVNSQWSQVENVYQRRADLVPNLVATVKGAANFEQQTLTQVVDARSRVGQVSTQATAEILNDPQKFQQFQQAQDQLSSALSRLLVVVERYPELKAVQGFRDLMNQLEGTENRIAVERKRFNEVAQEYNTRRLRFPTAMIANLMGFQARPYFQAQPGAETVPTVDFGNAAPPSQTTQTPQTPR